LYEAEQKAISSLPASTKSFTFYFPEGPDDCTFENGSCGWTNVGGDIFDWTLLMGKTPSRETGPATDHTTLRFGEFYATCRLTDSQLVNVPKVSKPAGKRNLKTHLYFSY